MVPAGVALDMKICINMVPASADGTTIQTLKPDISNCNLRGAIVALRRSRDMQ